MKEKHTGKASAGLDSAESPSGQVVPAGRSNHAFTGTVWADATFIRIVIGSVARKRVACDSLKTNSPQTRLTFAHRQAMERRDDFSTKRLARLHVDYAVRRGGLNAGGQMQE
jgi:hypothetical protein